MWEQSNWRKVKFFLFWIKKGSTVQGANCLKNGLGAILVEKHKYNQAFMKAMQLVPLSKAKSKKR